MPRILYASFRLEGRHGILFSPLAYLTARKACKVPFVRPLHFGASMSAKAIREYNGKQLVSRWISEFGDYDIENRCVQV